MFNPLFRMLFIFFWKQHIAYWCMSACLNAIENIAGRIFISYFCCVYFYKNTTHIGMKDICIYFFPMYFSPSLSARHGRNILCQQIKYTGRENHFATWIRIIFCTTKYFAIPVPVCSILERRQGFIHFFVYFPPHRRMWNSFFYCNFFFYVFMLLFFVIRLPPPSPPWMRMNVFPIKQYFLGFAIFSAKKYFVSCGVFFYDFPWNPRTEKKKTK